MRPRSGADGGAGDGEPMVGDDHGGEGGALYPQMHWLPSEHHVPQLDVPVPHLYMSAGLLVHELKRQPV